MDSPFPPALQLADADELPSGLVVEGRYRVVRLLGKGGMGRVYEVLDMRTDRRRALKMLNGDLALDAATAERFRKEATIAGRVESQHIVEVFDVGMLGHSGAGYLVMELLRGTDLGARLRTSGPAAPSEVIEWLNQVAAGLDMLHAESVVHRDLKPDNLFLCSVGNRAPVIKILDLGLAKSLACDETLTTTRNLGTPLYMAPEQMRGEAVIDHRADLYSLAHIAFALLVGSAYWTEELASGAGVYPLLMKANQGLPEGATARAARRGIELPGSFDTWFHKATALQVEERFVSATTQIEALRLALEHTGALPDAAHPLESVESEHGDDSVALRPRFSRYARVAAAIGALAIISATVLLLRSSKSHELAATPSASAPSGAVAPIASPSAASLTLTARPVDPLAASSDMSPKPLSVPPRHASRNIPGPAPTESAVRPSPPAVAKPPPTEYDPLDDP